MRRSLTLFALATVSTAVVSPAQAQFFGLVWLSGHVDALYATYQAGQLGLGLNNVDEGWERDPARVLLGVPKQARSQWPSGSQWAFFSNPGARVWVLPQTQNLALLYAGVSSESMTGTTFDRYLNTDPRVNRLGRWVGFEVKAVRGPGEFAVWQTDSFGNPVVWVATKDGLGANDVVWTLEGGHVHVNWGFSARGRYEVDVVVSARLGGQRIESPVTTYTFGVEWGFPIPVDDVGTVPLGARPASKP